MDDGLRPRVTKEILEGKKMSRGEFPNAPEHDKSTSSARHGGKSCAVDPSGAYPATAEEV